MWCAPPPDVHWVSVERLSSFSDEGFYDSYPRPCRRSGVPRGPRLRREREGAAISFCGHRPGLGRPSGNADCDRPSARWFSSNVRNGRHAHERGGGVRRGGVHLGPSTRPLWLCWVEMLELGAGVVDGEAPVDADAIPVASSRPSGGLARKADGVSDAAVEALAAEHA